MMESDGTPSRHVGMTRAEQDFTRYLSDTIIPDLRTTGFEATADDLATAATLIRCGAASPGFAEYLRRVAPDFAPETRKAYRRAARFLAALE